MISSFKIVFKMWLRSSSDYVAFSFWKKNTEKLCFNCNLIDQAFHYVVLQEAMVLLSS